MVKTIGIIGGIAPERPDLGREGTAADPAWRHRERGPVLGYNENPRGACGGADIDAGRRRTKR